MSTAPVASPRKRAAGNSQLPMTFIITIVPVCVALNIVGSVVSNGLKLPVYLDMIGTAVSAIVLGPWWGVLVGVLTNAGSSLINGPIVLPFMLANVAGALLWGYGVRSWKLGRTIPRFFLLNIIVGVALTIVSAPITVFVFGGATGTGADALTGAFVAVGQSLMASVFSSSILTSLADKIIGGFVALAIIEALPKSLTQNIDIIKATPLKGVLIAVAGVVIGVFVIAVFLAFNAGA